MRVMPRGLNQKIQYNNSIHTPENVKGANADTPKERMWERNAARHAKTTTARDRSGVLHDMVPLQTMMGAISQTNAHDIKLVALSTVVGYCSMTTSTNTPSCFIDKQE